MFLISHRDTNYFQSPKWYQMFPVPQSETLCSQYFLMTLHSPSSLKQNYIFQSLTIEPHIPNTPERHYKFPVPQRVATRAPNPSVMLHISDPKVMEHVPIIWYHMFLVAHSGTIHTPTPPRWASVLSCYWYGKSMALVRK